MNLLSLLLRKRLLLVWMIRKMISTPLRKKSNGYVFGVRNLKLAMPCLVVDWLVTIRRRRLPLVDSLDVEALGLLQGAQCK